MAERVLPQSFYARDALEVAPALLGKLLRHGEVVLRISEVEAYCHPDDSASHCRMGRTTRNAPMWGPPGYSYIYLCYGMHQMLNLVTNPEGEGAAILIRSCEPVSGHALIHTRRGGIEGPNALTGPGKVGAALGLTTAFSGTPLFDPEGLHLLDAPLPERWLVGPRVGIGYATPAHQQAPWRFALADSAWVTQRKTLVPITRVRSAVPTRSKRS
ncbi:MAG: DNA-3-methyladenine glycosylase [Polyangiales bacterium]